MRISDWSSDVCSSDLRIVGVRRGSVVVHGADMDRWTLAEGDRLILRVDAATLLTWREQGRFRIGIGRDRKSVVSGKRVSVRVDPGGSSIIKKKNKNIYQQEI